VMAVNLRVLRTRAAGHPSLARFDELGGLLTGRPTAGADDGIAWLERLRAELEVPGLGHYGMTTADLPALVAKAKVASSMKGNPIALTDAELGEVAARALASG
jgi:alcohol dehydrogenase class IV